MTAALVWIVSGLVASGNPPPPADSAADRVVLKDGRVLLGQVVDFSRRGVITVVARRAWVEENLPEWSKLWIAAEAPEARRALAQRKSRLTAWARDRETGVGRDDRIVTWIKHELEKIDVVSKHLAAAAVKPRSQNQKPFPVLLDGGKKPAAKPVPVAPRPEPPRAPDSKVKDNAADAKKQAADPKDSLSPLMIISLARSEIRSSNRARESSRNLLRLGWLAGFPKVESMPVDALKDSLEGRGLSTKSTGAVDIESLLPPRQETEGLWLSRRAATEANIDQDVRYIQMGPLVFPEPEPGEEPKAGQLAQVVGGVARMLAGEEQDSLRSELAKLAARGRSACVVTSVEVAPTRDGSTAVITLWGRDARGGWSRVITRSSVSQVADIDQGEANALAGDPQVQAVFGFIESLGLGAAGEQAKRLSLGVGATTRRALGQARETFNADIDRLALPVTGPKAKSDDD